MNFIRLLSEKLTFATLTLMLGLVYAFREGGSLASSVIIIASLAAHIWEKHELKKESETELQALKKDLQALQDRVGRTELSMGLKFKT